MDKFNELYESIMNEIDQTISRNQFYDIASKGLAYRGAFSKHTLDQIKKELDKPVKELSANK